MPHFKKNKKTTFSHPIVSELGDQLKEAKLLSFSLESPGQLIDISPAARTFASVMEQNTILQSLTLRGVVWSFQPLQMLMFRRSWAERRWHSQDRLFTEAKQHPNISGFE
jgi:hypothetical protein